MQVLNVSVITLLGSLLLCGASLNIANPGFEAPDLSTAGCPGEAGGPNYTYNPAGCGAGWTFSALVPGDNGSGIARNPSAFNNPVGPDSSLQSAFLQGTGSSFFQTITGMSVGSVYTFSFWAIERAGGSVDEAVSVDVDGTFIATNMLPNTTAWTQFTTNAFVAKNESAVLTFRGSDPDNSVGLDESLFVDQVTSTEMPEPGTWGLLASGLGGLFWSRRRRK